MNIQGVAVKKVFILIFKQYLLIVLGNHDCWRENSLFGDFITVVIDYVYYQYINSVFIGYVYYQYINNVQNCQDNKLHFCYFPRPSTIWLQGVAFAQVSYIILHLC